MNRFAKVCLTLVSILALGASSMAQDMHAKPKIMMHKMVARHHPMTKKHHHMVVHHKMVKHHAMMKHHVMAKHHPMVHHKIVKHTPTKMVPKH